MDKTIIRRIDARAGRKYSEGDFSYKKDNIDMINFSLVQAYYKRRLYLIFEKMEKLFVSKESISAHIEKGKKEERLRIANDLNNLLQVARSGNISLNIGLIDYIDSLVKS